MPASGPGKSATVAAITGRPNAAKRTGPPLALRMRPSHCGSRRAMTRSRMLRPPIRRIGLSPPPMRRARPPARRTPGVAGISLVTVAAFALVARGFFRDEFQILIEHDPLLPRQRNETLAAGAPDQRQSDLPCQIDAPRGEARTRHQDGNSHPHGL